MAPIALSPMAVPVGQPDEPTVAAATKPAPVVVAAAPALHPKDAEFMRLSQSTNPADLSRAYSMAYDCLQQQQMLERTGVQEDPRSPVACGVAPGHWQDTANRKRLITAAVERADFYAFNHLRDEGPRGRWGSSGAFADDPAGYKALMAKAYQIGVAQAEPSALSEASLAWVTKGYSLQEKGQTEQSKAAYAQAFTAAVAAEVNVQRQYCTLDPSRCAAPAVSLEKLPGFQSAPQFSQAERAATASSWPKGDSLEDSSYRTRHRSKRPCGDDVHHTVVRVLRRGRG
jgi:hypothetical protein